MSDPNAISAAPLVADLMPIITATILAVIAVIIRAAASIANGYLGKWTGIQIQKAAIDRVTSAAQSLAAAEVAKAGDNLATASIPVGSPLVAGIASKIISTIPNDLAAAGITPDRVAGIVAGEFGKLQASMSVVVAPEVAPAK